MSGVARLYPTLTLASVRAREAALTRYAGFSAALAVPDDPARAVAGVGLLYDLLPPESRERPPDPRGVAALHRALSVLGARR